MGGFHDRTPSRDSSRVKRGFAPMRLPDAADKERDDALSDWHREKTGVAGRTTGCDGRCLRI